MKKVIFYLITTACALMASCGDGGNGEVLEKLNSSYELEGQTVTLKGYLAVPRRFSVDEYGRAAIDLYSAAGQGDNATSLAALKMGFGKEPNCFWVPEEYRGSDMEIYDSAGGKHGYLKRIVVTGTVHYINKDWQSALQDETEPHKMGAAFEQMRAKSNERIRAAAEERKKATGDENDYSFWLDVQTVTLP
ncbi:MAG: hypothetical protein LBU95_00300 [Rikenellaceae bacterium]|jgi:hypothetical protein|nr:hypothetical protein [Rikenellaceae bacterium]